MNDIQQESQSNGSLFEEIHANMAFICVPDWKHYTSSFIFGEIYGNMKTAQEIFVLSWDRIVN